MNHMRNKAQTIIDNHARIRNLIAYFKHNTIYIIIKIKLDFPVKVIS